MIEALIGLCVGLFALGFFVILPIGLLIAGIVGTIRFFMGERHE